MKSKLITILLTFFYTFLSFFPFYRYIIMLIYCYVKWLHKQINIITFCYFTIVDSISVCVLMYFMFKGLGILSW